MKLLNQFATEAAKTAMYVYYVDTNVEKMTCKSNSRESGSCPRKTNIAPEGNCVWQ